MKIEYHVNQVEPRLVDETITVMRSSGWKLLHMNQVGDENVSLTWCRADLTRTTPVDRLVEAIQEAVELLEGNSDYNCQFAIEHLQDGLKAYRTQTKE